MAERDLPRYREETYQSQGPGRIEWVEADLDEVLRLVHLNCIPGEEGAEERECNPPEPRRPQRPGQCPVHRRPHWVDDVGVLARCGILGNCTIRHQTKIFGPLMQ